KPSPLRRKEVENFLSAKEEGGEAAVRKGRPRVEYEIGETIRVKEGPFADLSGEVSEINEDQLKVKVMVNICGRETPVELELSQLAKLSAARPPLRSGTESDRRPTVARPLISRSTFPWPRRRSRPS